jgi:diaminohydroxyphosphoribosylaminopyrimidine deaminase/5-amino-6-(5-phosphoribosylamino)uracil reductase
LPDVEHDATFMRRAVRLAENSRGLAEPNPTVGAVIVAGGRVVGEGWTAAYGGPHAEIAALEQAGEAARGATMYVTLEPCAHQGKTPPCAPELVRAGLHRVIMAVLDPTQKTRDKGRRLLEREGVRTEVGLCREEAVRQNAAFFKRAATGKPLVIAKWAMTADGKIATRTGDSRWISGAESRRRVHELRGMVDCVIIGVGTALRDDPRLTCRDAEKRRRATRLVLCSGRVPPPDARLFATLDEAPLVLAYPECAPPTGLDTAVEDGAEALPVPAEEGSSGRLDPATLLEELGRRHMANVLIEGGAETLGAFFDAGQVDRVLVFVAPRVAGGRDATTAVAGRGIERMDEAHELLNVETERIGPDILIQGWVRDPLSWLP